MSDLEALTPGASNPEDRDTEKEHRARLENIDPQGMLTRDQRERILEQEQAEADRVETLKPQEGDSLEVKSALARQRYAEAADVEYKFVTCTADDCQRRLTYYGPTGVDHSNARCPQHAENQADTDPDTRSDTGTPDEEEAWLSGHV